MEGFEKLTLQNNASSPKIPAQKDTMSASPIRAKKRIYLTKKTGIIAGAIVLFLLILVFAVIFPLVKTLAKAKVAYASAKEVLDGVKKENVQVASDKLAETKQKLLDTQSSYRGMAYLSFIPIVNWYYSDGAHLLQAGLYGIDAGQVLVDAVKPYADLLGLKGQGSFVMGSASQRIQTAVTTMGKVTPKIDDIEKELVLAKKEVDAVNPNHYPSFLDGGKIKDQLSKLQKTTDQVVSFVDEARPLIRVLPTLLGEPTEKKYLVIFQNDKELRPTGGFMTGYAIFRIEHGVIHVDNSNDIYSLDNTISAKPPAPRPILLYLPKVPQFNLRDSNLSPDFITSMDTFNSMYKNAGGYEKVDGIIAVDTHALVTAMDVLGDINVGGVNYTTKKDDRCNCAEVIYQLEVYADQPVNFVKQNRKGLIGDLLFAIMQKALSSSPKKYWGPLFQSMIAEVGQKHILFDLYNSDAQSGIEALNAAGRIQAVDGDYLHINEANFGGAKSNMYISESVSQSYQISGDGSVTKTVKITYKNPFPPSDCNLERGGLCLNAILRDWVRVYVPKGSQLVTSEGSEVKVTSYDELGKSVFEGFLTVRPLGSSVYTLTYKLPFKLAKGSPLPLLMQKQPGTAANEYDIIVNGAKLQTFQLLSDKSVKLSQ